MFSFSHHLSLQRGRKGGKRERPTHSIEGDKEKWMEQRRGDMKQNSKRKTGSIRENKTTNLAVFNRTHCYLLSHQFNIACKNSSSVALHTYSKCTGSWHTAPVKQSLYDCSKKNKNLSLYTVEFVIKTEERWEMREKKREILTFDH